MIMRTIALTVAALAAFTTAAQAQTVPPKELQVPRVFCSQFPAEGQSFMNQLAGGGTWERVNAKTFVYGVRPHDPVTNRAEEYRFMFVREDNELSCGDVKPCAHMTRASRNGYEMGNYKFQQLCSLLLINAKTASALKGAAPQAQAQAQAQPEPQGEAVATTAGELRLVEHRFILNGQIIAEDQELAPLSVAGKWPQSGPTKAVLVAVQGGTACPALYRIVDTSSTPTVTEHLGNCSDLPKASFDGRRLKVDFPAFRSAGAESYVYADGELRARPEGS